MIEKRFQKRYIEKNNKVYDTFKEMSITDELNSDSLLNVLSHLNGLGEMIDTKIEQGKYCMKKYKALQKENYGNLDGLNYYQEQNGHLSSKISDLECENEQLKHQLKESEETIDTICKDYEDAHGMDIRNAEWFTAW